MADESRASHNELTTEEPSSSSSELISDLEGDSTADVEDLLLARAAATGVGIDDGSEDLDEDDDDDMSKNNPTFLENMVLKYNRSIYAR